MEPLDKTMSSSEGFSVLDIETTNVSVRKEATVGLSTGY